MAKSDIDINIAWNPAWQKRLHTKLKNATITAANAYLNFMRGFVPVLTGRLRRSFAIGAFKWKKGEYVGVHNLSGQSIRLPGTNINVFTDAPYALFVEYGTSKMRAQPYLRPSYILFKKKMLDIYVREMKTYFYKHFTG